METSAWLVLPTYDEAANLETVAGAALRALERSPVSDVHVLVVDDASPDGTGELADDLARRDPRVEVLHRPGKEGIGPAYLAGFAYALERGADYVLEMDADLSHDPRDIVRLLARAAEGADVVLGSRYVAGGGTAGWGRVRQVISRGGSWYARRVLGIGVRDLTGGFKCFRREVLETVDLSTVGARGYAFQVELTYRALRAGFGVVEVPIIFSERRAGRSKMSWAIAAEAVWLIPRMRHQATGAAPRPAAELLASSE